MFVIEGEAIAAAENEVSKFKADALEMEKIFNRPPFYSVEIIEAPATSLKDLQTRLLSTQLEGVEKVIIYYTGHTEPAVPERKARRGYTPIKLAGKEAVKMSELLKYGLSLQFKLVVVGGVVNLNSEDDSPPDKIEEEAYRPASLVFSSKLWSGEGGVIFFSCSPKQSTISTKEYVPFTRTLLATMLSDSNTLNWTELLAQTATNFSSTTVTFFSNVDKSSPILRML